MQQRIKRKLEPLIRERGISNVAKRAGISQPYLSRWLREDIVFGVDRMQAIAAAVGVDLVVELSDNANTWSYRIGKKGRT